MDATFIKTDSRANGAWILAIAPLFVLPTLAYVLFEHSPAWQLMWMLTISTYLGFKWLTFATCHPKRRIAVARALSYLLLWPGMDAPSFLDSDAPVARPTFGEALWGLTKLVFGLLLLFVGVPAAIHDNPLIAGWVGMAGLVFVLHFGLAHLLSICWRLKVIDAEPIMNAPILATSLSDFWGRRWNLAFRDVAFGQIFRPLVGSLGILWATMAVFLVSGVVHDLIISIPAQGGGGGPTLYFLIQGFGLLLERSRVGQRIGLGRGYLGWLFCALVTIGPVGLLFHEPFVRHVILPTLATLGIH